MSGKVWRWGQSGLKEARPKRTQTHGGHMADKVEMWPKRTPDGQWRTADNGEHMADKSAVKAGTKRTQGGHMADELQGCGLSISRQAFSF